MDESKPKPLGKQTPAGTTPEPPAKTDASIALEQAFARGSGHINDVSAPPERRTEHSVMEGLPQAKAERIASIYREVAELQRQLSTAQQRIATELQGRAEDADRVEALEARLQAHEQKAEQDATRVTELEREIAGLRAQLASATADVAARDVKLDEARQQHQDVTGQFDAQSASLREARTLLETRDAELATRTSERDAEQATRSRLERELDDERKSHGVAIATRDQELAAITSERDSLKADLEKARGELETGRAKARDLATQFAKFGQELDGVALTPAPAERPHRSQPPPVPPPRAAVPVETVLEVTEEPKPASGVRSVLLLVGGVLVGCAAMFAMLQMTNSSATAAGSEPNVGAPPPSELAVPLSAPPPSESAAAPTIHDEAAVDPTPPAAQPAPTPPPTETIQQPAAPAETKTEGVILLPEAAAGHRVYVDGRKVPVKDSRAVVPCGEREIRIGSRGVAQTLDVACGGETAIPAEPR